MKNLNACFMTTIFMFAGVSYGANATETSTAKPQPAPAGITDSASSTRSSNTMGQLLNIAMGGANLYAAKQCFAQCSAWGSGCCAMAAPLFLMGVQNLMQAAAQGETAGQAGSAVGATYTGWGESGYDPNAVKALQNDPQYKEGKEFMATVAKGGAGFTYDPKTGTVTTASGKTLKSGDVNSASAMAAAGIPKSAIDTIGSMEKDILAKAEKKVSKFAVAASSSEESSSGGGGGGGFDSSTSSADGDLSYGGPAGRIAGLGIDRDPAQVAGMQKNYNGDPIGVAGDSIFKMMTRRYKTKEAQSSFLDGSELLIQK
jgi:hypothetical protein